MLKQRPFRMVIFSLVILTGIILYLLEPRLHWSILQSLGTELFTAGFIAMLLEIILRDEFIEVLKKEYKAPLKELEIGIKADSTFVHNFYSARDKIDIMALSCSRGRKNYEKLLVSKIYDDYCNIRILILDPDSEFVEKRARDEPDANAEERINNETMHSIEFFKNLKSAINAKYKPENPLKGSICVKTHKSIPYFGYTRMDDYCFVSFYFAGAYGIHSPVIEFRKHTSQLFDKFEKHFDVLWERKDSRTVVDIGIFDRTDHETKVI